MVGKSKYVQETVVYNLTINYRKRFYSPYDNTFIILDWTNRPDSIHRLEYLQSL